MRGKANTAWVSTHVWMQSTSVCPVCFTCPNRTTWRCEWDERVAYAGGFVLALEAFAGQLVVGGWVWLVYPPQRGDHATPIPINTSCRANYMPHQHLLSCIFQCPRLGRAPKVQLMYRCVTLSLWWHALRLGGFTSWRYSPDQINFQSRS